MRSKLVSLMLGWASLVSAQAITATPINKAIVPTSSGQIGVNPVSMYPLESYHAPHAHTEYWDQEPSTTKVRLPDASSMNATNQQISGLESTRST